MQDVDYIGQIPVRWCAHGPTTKKKQNELSKVNRKRTGHRPTGYLGLPASSADKWQAPPDLDPLARPCTRHQQLWVSFFVVKERKGNAPFLSTPFVRLKKILPPMGIKYIIFLHK